MLIGREALFFQRQLAYTGFLTNGAVVYFTGYLPAHNFLRYPMQNREARPADILPGWSRFVGWNHNCDKCTEKITNEEAA